MLKGELLNGVAEPGIWGSSTQARSSSTHRQPLPEQHSNLIFELKYFKSNFRSNPTLNREPITNLPFSRKEDYIFSTIPILSVAANSLGQNCQCHIMAEKYVRSFWVSIYDANNYTVSKRLTRGVWIIPPRLHVLANTKTGWEVESEISVAPSRHPPSINLNGQATAFVPLVNAAVVTQHGVPPAPRPALPTTTSRRPQQSNLRGNNVHFQSRSGTTSPIGATKQVMPGLAHNLQNSKLVQQDMFVLGKLITI